MRYLILSDIHANWDALEAVLSHAAGRYDKILCCGDIVGYGAEPNRVVEWTRANTAAIVRGNHDKACAGSEDLEWFNPVARISALWTQKTLTSDNLDYLRALPKGPLTVGNFQLLHGSPLDEDEYLINTMDVAQIAAYVEPAVSFFGHTHLQGGFFVNRKGVKRIPAVPPLVEDRSLELTPDVLYLFNPGSVGQPRDNDPRAAYALYTPEERYITFRRTTYDLARAQGKIVKAGLPELLALRLAVGS